MSLRLDADLAERLQAVAEVEGRAVSDVIREAIATHVEKRRRDPKFQRLLDENLRKHERLLRLLRDGSGSAVASEKPAAHKSGKESR